LQLLIDTALKFSEGEVEVRLWHENDQVHIAVSDQGIGIAHDKLEAIFETFYQIDNSSTRRYGGVGVGLAIVRLILERHHVEIGVESTEGKGSTFSFALPVAVLPS
jgi:signal transduction histidine kinase